MKKGFVDFLDKAGSAGATSGVGNVALVKVKTERAFEIFRESRKERSGRR